MTARRADAASCIAARAAPSCAFSTPFRCSLSLSEEEKEALAKTMARRTYRKGDVLMPAGRQAHVVERHPQRRRLRLAAATRPARPSSNRLSPGDYFGESGLFTGSGEIGSFRR